MGDTAHNTAYLVSLPFVALPKIAFGNFFCLQNVKPQHVSIPEAKVQYSDILEELKSLSDPKAIEGMAKYGITPEKTYGVPIPNLRKIAKEIGDSEDRFKKC